MRPAYPDRIRLKLKTKIWLAIGLIFASGFLLLQVHRYHNIQADALDALRLEARMMGTLLMASGEVFHKTAIASGLPMTGERLDLLPIHAIARIAEDLRARRLDALQIRLLSTDSRNPDNLPNDFDRDDMEYFKRHPQAIERLRLDDDSSGSPSYHYTQPIWTQGYCLTCHGTPERVPANLGARQAPPLGYREGDLRAILSIRLSSSPLERYVREHFWYALIDQLLMFAGVFVAIGLLLQRFVIDKLARLRHATQVLADGDYGARVTIAGHDELAELAAAFNRMAERLAVHERQLAENEARWRLAQEAAHIGVWDLDLRTDRLYCTPECEQLYSQPAGSLNCGTDWRALIEPEDLVSLVAQWTACLAQRVPFEAEYRVRRPGGETRWLLSRGQAHYDDAGQPIRVAGVELDITERKHFVARLDFLARRSEALRSLPSLADSLDEAAFMQAGQEMAEDLTGSRIAFIHFVNEGEATIELVTWSRRTLEEYCTAVYETHYPVDQAGLWADALRRRAPIIVNDYATATGKRGLPAGHAELKRLISVPVIEQGAVVMLTGVGNKSSDYTEQDIETVELISNLIWNTVQRRRAQSRLQTLALAVEQTPLSVIITDVEARIEYVNSAFEQTTGYTLDEIRGQNPRLLQSGQTPLETFRDLWHDLTGGRHWRGEFINRRKDGEFYHELAAIAPIRTASGTASHYVAVQEDVTEKRRLSEELDRHRQHLEAMVAARTRELEQALDRAEAATRAKSAFLANMSHEIRTPMNAILGLTYLLYQEGLTSGQRERLDKIDAAAHHLLGLINDILDLSKIEADKLVLEMIDFSPRALLDEVRSMILAAAQAKGL